MFGQLVETPDLQEVIRDLEAHFLLVEIGLRVWLFYLLFSRTHF